MPSSAASSSNWDFTPVINLLRSPTFGDGDQSRLSRHTSQGPSTPREAPKDVLDSPSHQARALDQSSGLGDFSSLWNTLGNATTPTRTKVEPRLELPKVAAAQPPSPPTKRIEILKRPSDKAKDAEIIHHHPPRTPPKPIPGSHINPKPCKSTVKSTRAKHSGHDSKAAFDSSSPGSNPETESDGNFSIFDPSFSKKKGVFSLVPPQVGAPAANNSSCETPPSSYDEAGETLTPRAVKNLPSGGSLHVQPIAYNSVADRRVGLLTKLLKNFPEYAETVVQCGRPVKSKTGTSASRPIHVFVDMSNIMVGFHDSVKVSRNIPVKTRIRRLPLSFQNFSLILERGRPTAKQVLVGSDRFAAINEGEKLGYEANILDRVQKVKQPTRRQLKFRKNPRAGGQDGGSNSETNEAPAERWVEQGVDEILHLKILESLLDTDEPATIVLATGDAAEAEFSGGFMKMVERALQRGWSVELVSFVQVTSYAYRKKEFRAKWGDRFKVIALDDYIEELLDM